MEQGLKDAKETLREELLKDNPILELITKHWLTKNSGKPTTHQDLHAQLKDIAKENKISFPYTPRQFSEKMRLIMDFLRLYLIVDGGWAVSGGRQRYSYSLKPVVKLEPREVRENFEGELILRKFQEADRSLCGLKVMLPLSPKIYGDQVTDLIVGLGKIWDYWWRARQAKQQNVRNRPGQ